MMSEADDAFLLVHLGHVQPKSRHKIVRYLPGQPFGCKIQTEQEPELMAKMSRECLFQDHWLKDSA